MLLEENHSFMFIKISWAPDWKKNDKHDLGFSPIPVGVFLVDV